MMKPADWAAAGAEPKETRPAITKKKAERRTNLRMGVCIVPA
jgi:hypothetical protein